MHRTLWIPLALDGVLQVAVGGGCRRKMGCNVLNTPLRYHGRSKVLTYHGSTLHDVFIKR